MHHFIILVLDFANEIGQQKLQSLRDLKSDFKKIKTNSLRDLKVACNTIALRFKNIDNENFASRF
jgi:hypothetical protein